MEEQYCSKCNNLFPLENFRVPSGKFKKICNVCDPILSEEERQKKTYLEHGPEIEEKIARFFEVSAEKYPCVKCKRTVGTKFWKADGTESDIVGNIRKWNIPWWKVAKIMEITTCVCPDCKPGVRMHRENRLTKNLKRPIDVMLKSPLKPISKPETTKSIDEVAATALRASASELFTKYQSLKKSNNPKAGAFLAAYNKVKKDLKALEGNES